MTTAISHSSCGTFFGFFYLYGFSFFLSSLMSLGNIVKKLGNLRILDLFFSVFSPIQFFYGPFAMSFHLETLIQNTLVFSVM